MESTGSENVENDNNSVHQYKRMTLRFRGKGGMAGEKTMNSRQSRAAKKLPMPVLGMVSGCFPSSFDKTKVYTTTISVYE